MSAYMVSHEHINTILATTLALSMQMEHPEFWLPPSISDSVYGDRPRTPTRDQMTGLGQFLLGANAKSLDARYGHHGPRGGDMYDEDHVSGYVFQPEPRKAAHDAGYLAKMLACYEYQACEFDGWEQSEAKKWCNWARDCALRAMPSYKAAPWGL